MAVLSAAQLLDELMGRDRNLAPTESRREIRWDDTEVCKYFLCGFCPYELFTNTRADLGTCDKLHDDNLKKRYQESNRFERMGYEEEFLRYLQSLLSDVERRIRRGHARLALNNSQGSMLNNPNAQKEEKVQMLTERINELVERAEELGCQGNVEEAQGVMKLCDQFKEEREHLESAKGHNDLPMLKEMHVCEICGAFLVVGDAQQRIDEHIMGKQHMGYARVRSTVEVLIKNDGHEGRLRNEQMKTMEVCTICGALLVSGDAQERIDEHLSGKQHMGYARIRAYVEGRRLKKTMGRDDPEREARLTREREEREKEREKEREERRKRQEERERERDDRRKRRSRSRDRGHRSNRRSRSRDRDRRRSRSRERRRSRDRRRSRSRERRSKDSHQYSRERSSRHGSRDHDRRSKDRSSRDMERSSRDSRERSSKDKENGRGDYEDRDARDRHVSEDRHARDDKYEESDRSAARPPSPDSTENQGDSY